MQQNIMNSQYMPQAIPLTPNAVNINIIQPQAFATKPDGINSSNCPAGFYSIYGANSQPGIYYPQNYNANIYPQYSNIPQFNNNVYYQNPANLQGMQEYSPNMNMMPNYNTMANQGYNQTGQHNYNQQYGYNYPNAPQAQTGNKEENKTNKKPKKITPLTNEYVKSIENYLNNNNPKVRLIGAKELMERFKEDENRKDNPSLIPLLNKTLKDSSPSVKFLGLTTLQLGYCTGNNETVELLKQIQADKSIGEDALLASEILLKMSAPQEQTIK